MAELLQDAAALLLPPPAGVALTLLLLELSLAQPARPALAASIAIAAIAATVICLIPALLVRACKIKRIIIPNGRARAPPPRTAPAWSAPLPGPASASRLPPPPCRWSGSYLTNVPWTRLRGITTLWRGRRGWL